MTEVSYGFKIKRSIIRLANHLHSDLLSLFWQTRLLTNNILLYSSFANFRKIVDDSFPPFRRLQLPFSSISFSFTFFLVNVFLVAIRCRCFFDGLPAETNERRVVEERSERINLKRIQDDSAWVVDDLDVEELVLLL